MKVLQLFTTVSLYNVEIAHGEIDQHNAFDRNAYINQFLPAVKSSVLEKTDHHIEIAHFEEKYDDPQDNEERIDVSLVIEGVPHSLSFIPWRVLLNCEVVCNIPGGLADAYLAAHLYREISFHGETEEGSISVADELSDRVEAVTNGHVDIKPFDLAEALFGDDPEEQAKFEQDINRFSENLKTVKVYKNGVLQENGFDPFTKPVIL